MTETVMNISNPNGGGRPPSVDLPLPGVGCASPVPDRPDVALWEILVRGPNVFARVLAAAHSHDGRFRTGDLGAFDDGYVRIAGARNSIRLIWRI